MDQFQKRIKRIQGDTVPEEDGFDFEVDETGKYTFTYTLEFPVVRLKAGFTKLSVPTAEQRAEIQKTVKDYDGPLP